MGFSRQEYWSGLPCPHPGDLPDPGTELMAPASPALQMGSLLLRYWGSPSYSIFCCSVDKSCPILSDPMSWSMPAFPVLHYFLEFAQTHVHWVRHAIQSFHPLLSPSPLAFNLTQHHGLSNESALCTRWSKNRSFSFSISSSNEYSGLISFRIDWFDILAVQGTLKSLLQHHSLTTSILQRLAFFMV